MKKLLILALVAALCLFMSSGAFAQDQAAKDPVKAKPAVKQAKKAVTKVQAEVTGKIECKMVKNRKGEEKEACLVTVSCAKGVDGKALDNLKGKTLRIIGKKAAEAKKLAGKETVLTGAIADNKRLILETAKEAASAAAAPACTAAPAAAAPAEKK